MIRRTPLKRSQKPLKRTPIRRVSKKRAKENRLYYQLRRTFLGVNPTCQANLPEEKVFCTHYSTDVHHVLRRGKYLNVPSTWLAVCRNCHEYLHQHPSMARTLNLLK